MVKKISVVALAGLMMLPAVASANTSDLEAKIEELSRQLNELKAVVAAQKETNEEQDEVLEELDEKSEGWDESSRFKFYGDFRSRLDYYNADTAGGNSLENDTLWSNRLRLNMRVKATENVEFKGRLAMYKTWGNQSAFTDESGAMWPVFDGNVTRTPVGSSALYVDRAFVNWNNIGGLPMWFSIGRRPTTDGSPAEVRLGLDERQATPMAFMDWPFDGISVGYAWDWGSEMMGSSRIRFCYGRGFESGLYDSDDSDSVSQIDDMDFAGLSWDIMKSGDRFAYIQSFMAFNVINYPNFQDPIINQAFGEMSGMGARDNLGKIWHTSAVYKNKVKGLNYFVAAGHSQTQPDSGGMGMFSDFAGMGAGLVGPNSDNENGYSLYAGLRYDLDDAGLKFGAEFNYGSEYWLAMSPGHDEIYQSKLATRGQVYELYAIYDLPTGETISKYAKTFIRLGYQHYEYDYSGSGDWNMKPYDLSSSYDLAMLQAMGQDPVESADQIYLTFEAYF
ncbi:DUF3373 family protein [Desulfosediminicola flagellatus]|uniref:DUF3373 family protein n=1 Tax=Desulfosediminicola flagellatus TaxID=2569541 RepID=UPI0010AB9D17|nr:DUF3373 family protein [Desulfosediminicola flagellatus]